MNKIDNLVIKYILYSLPAVIALLIWGSTGNPDELSMSEGLTRIIWDTLGWVFIFWILLSFYICLKTVFSKTFRDIFLSKITRIKERDEREAEISGNAAKFSFFSTLAILFLFLFLSLFTVTIGKHPEKEIKQDKTGYISLGMQFKAYDFEENKKEQKDDSGMIIVNYTDLPITKAGLLLLLFYGKLEAITF